MVFEIQYDPKIVSHNQLIKAIEDTGFEAVLISSGEDRSKIHLKVDGVLTRPSMAMIETSLQILPGVENVEIDTVVHRIYIAYKPDQTGPRIFIHVIESVTSGRFKATIFPEGGREPHKQDEIKQYYKSFLWSLGFRIPLRKD
ncbi:hypothetical protein GIB67_041154 [Kingdonia uniflora]|uniref:Uncharacterized protein n=1 Tax=Kingdonia uniflora TaxID=39325 RepID=A0A7J7LKA3_9MAGN|nr:hypothetical protein GIB67_041154 [Kingdonia uniflora]